MNSADAQAALSKRRSALAAAAGCAAVGLFFWLPMAVQCRAGNGGLSCDRVIDRNGQTDDGRLFAMLWDASRRALLDYGELPSWNPYHCGGRPLYADPQAPFPGPMFLLTFFWLPSVVGLKLWILVHLVFGALGARLLVRDRGGNAPEQLLAAGLVCACGFFAEHLGGGHLSFTPFLFLPWILWAFRRSLRDARWSVMTACLFALTVIEGGPVPLLMMPAALLLEVPVRLGSAEDRRGLGLSLPLLGLLAPLLAAVRLLPILDLLRNDSRPMPLDDRMTLAEVLQSLLAGDRPRLVPGHPYVWPEYNDYVGVVPVVLVAAGLLLALLPRVGGQVTGDAERRARRIDAAVLLGLVWLTLGNIPGFSLFGLLHELPVFRSLRVPSRFLYPATVLGALGAVSTLVALRRRLVERARPGLLRAFAVAEVLLALFVIGDLCRTNWPRLQQGTDPSLPAGPPLGAFHQDSHADYGELATHPARRVGTPQCYTSFDLQAPRGLWSGAAAQERLEPAQSGSAQLLRWAPSSITYRVALGRPATLVLNQAFDRGWRATEGFVAPRPDGLLAVQLAAGDREVTLRHRPPWLWTGALLSLLGVAASVLVVRRFSVSRQNALRTRIRAALTGRRKRGTLLDSLRGDPIAIRPQPLPGSSVEKRQYDYDSIPVGFYDQVLRGGNPIRRLWHLSKFERVLDCLGSGESLLDIGCFAGSFLSLVPQGRFRKQLGVDILKSQVDYANLHYGTAFREFRHIHGIDDLVDLHQTFDCITLIEVIEHLRLEQVTSLLERVSNMLNPGGHLVITTPNYLSAWPLLEAVLNRISDVVYEEQHISRFNYFNIEKKLSRLYEPFRRRFEVSIKTTSHFLTPFLAAFSFAAARALSRLVSPQRWRHPFGSLIVLVATRTPCELASAAPAKIDQIGVDCGGAGSGTPPGPAW